MSAAVPSVLVSSTFYDLRQVRADLTGFLADELGFVPLLSELASFPVDPDTDTIENCCRRVEQDADAVILIIGGRYGAVDSRSARSITNLEYLTARQKGIPVFAFVETRVLALMPVWEKNRSADFSTLVDDTRVFEFIRDVRDVHKVWTREFDNAQQIIAALRAQFARMTLDGLKWALRLRDDKEELLHRSLRGKALRLVLERPEAWEYRLFAQVLVDEVQAASDFKRKYHAGIALGIGERITRENFASWTLTRLSELERVAHAISVLVNRTARTAFRPPGQPGDAELIAFAAQQVGACYCEAIEWTARVRRASAEDEMCPALETLAGFSGDIIQKVEEFGPHVLLSIDNVLAEAKGSKRIVEFSLVIGVTGSEEFRNRVRALSGRWQ